MSSNKFDNELTQPLVYEVDPEDFQPVKKERTINSNAPVRGGISCCCKFALIALGLFFVVAGIASWAMYSVVGDVVAHLTVPTPHEKFPVIDMTEPELEAVKSRVETFFEDLRAGKAESPLVVSQDEINGFIGHSDFLRGNMWVTVQDGSIQEEFSLPAELLPGGRGRFFVGDDYLKVHGDQIEIKMETAATHEDWFDGPLLFAQLQHLVSGEDILELYLIKGSYFGQEAPQEFIDEHKNLLDHLYNDPDAEDARVVLENIERVDIETGKIVVVPRKH